MVFRLTSVWMRAFGLAAGALIAAAAPAVHAQSVDEIVNRSNLASYYQGQSGRARVTMTITDAQGRERVRAFTILRRDTPTSDALVGGAYRGEQKYYVYFHRPADVRKMALLVWKHIRRDDDRWLYLPALDLVKRIAASDKRTSFAGSDFFYEDVSGRSIDLDTHELIDTTDAYYVVRNRPTAPGEVEFSYYDMYIHQGTFLPVQTEYYDRRGRKYRIARVLKVERIQGFNTVVEASMQDLTTGSTTVLRYADVTYDIGVPDGMFTERYLRRAPTQYLR